MKRFAFLKLFPAGWGSGNKVLAECQTNTIKEAQEHFQPMFPHIVLNCNGYAKVMETTYCIAEYVC